MLQLFEAVFLQEYWLQGMWFIFNLAGSKSESSLLKSLLVGELKNICRLIKKIKDATPWCWAFLVLHCYVLDRTCLWEGGDGAIFWSREMTEPAVSQPLVWPSVLLEIKVWDETEQGILLLGKGHGHVNISFSAHTSQFNQTRKPAYNGTGWGDNNFPTDCAVGIRHLGEQSWIQDIFWWFIAVSCQWMSNY